MRDAKARLRAQDTPPAAKPDEAPRYTFTAHNRPVTLTPEQEARVEKVLEGKMVKVDSPTRFEIRTHPDAPAAKPDEGERCPECDTIRRDAAEQAQEGGEA